MRKLPLLLAAILILTAGLVWAEDQTVKLKSGKAYTGEVTEIAGGSYRIKASDGTVITVLKTQIESMGPAVDLGKEFKERLAKIDTKNADDHVAVAEWAFSVGLLQQAHQELKAALAIKSDHRRADLLLRKVEAAIEEAKTATTQTATVPTVTSTRPGIDSFDKAFLPMEDIYRIRLQEMKGTDQVSVEFTNNLIERFIKRLEGVDPDFKENPKASDAFRALPRPAQALKIRKEVDRDFKDPTKWLNDIQVKSDPKFIQEYRLKVWPVIRGHCATADCHGGADGKGHLRLFTGANNERAEYTNFIILDGFANADGRMFDRENSEDSLILQYGLPTEQAKVHHPKIARELKVFDDRKVKQYGDIESWIRSLRSSPHPDYFLAWKPPAGIGLDFGTGAVFKDLTPTTAPAKPK